ncbi:hypothetical protein GCM10010988_39480 [Cnuibacter physcomitrellae]|nr:hypothetical protein GCM10010988_39480 [Cnuibacter physcomitrellae]
MPVLLRVDGERYLVDGDVDLDRLRTELVAAVRAGGDLVHVLHSRGSADVMITSSRRVELAYIPSQAAMYPTPGEPDVAFVDWEDL